MDEASLFAAALERPAGAERRAFLDAACGGDQALRVKVERLLAADEHPAGILDAGPPAGPRHTRPSAGPPDQPGRPAMPASADRNLLFGILAVQLDFVTKDALVAAMGAWLLDKAKPLGDILRDHGHLSTERLQLLAALVAEHLKQHDGDTQRSLAALSSVPPALRQQLAALPDEGVQQSVGRVGGGRPGRDAGETIDAPPSSAVRYRILRPHAKGGLGEVFVAEDTELGRTVALKEIQDCYSSDLASRDRFVREAAITGGLEHPGIVPVYGLGTYADGRPFYAMRLIRGDNLKTAIRRFHCAPGPPVTAGSTAIPQGTDTPRSPRFDSVEFRQLLRRFVDMCNAVAYAHSRGILHRDLKPGNIMLGKYGETLVVDWGLAKAVGRADATDANSEVTLNPRSSGESSPTEMGQALGTPAYMAPEQAAGKLDELGPATDVYSLGATLYELLAGQPPFLEVDLEAVQQGSFPPPRKVLPAVPRPLEAVCLKAMAPRPADRYATPLALAAEVEQWLADEPVTAYREPAGARARRWVRKHSRLTTGMAAALAVGAAALGLLALERERARVAVATKEAETARERDAKEAEREKAVAERDRAVAARKRTREALDAMVSGVTHDSLSTQSVISPEQKAFLESVLSYYEEFAAEPGEDREGRERLAGAHHRLGMIRFRLGQQLAGAAVFARAADLYAALAADFPDAIVHRRNVGHARNALGVTLTGLGRLGKAEAAFRAALAVQERLMAEAGTAADRAALALTYSNLGFVLRSDGRRGDAEAVYRSALAVQQMLVAEFPAAAEYRQELANTHTSLGNVLVDLGKSAAAEAAYRSALAEQEKLVAAFPTMPDYRRDLGRTHNNLAGLFDQRGQQAVAETAYRAALAEQVRLAAEFPAVPEYRQELARTRSNLSAVLGDLSRRAEAEAECRAALALREKLVADAPATPAYRHQLSGSHVNLAVMLMADGKRADAEAAFRAALALAERLVAEVPAAPEYRQRLAGIHHNLGGLLETDGRPTEADAAFRAALAVREKLASDFPNEPEYAALLGNTYVNLGQLSTGRGDHAAALDWNAKAVARLTPLVAAEPRQVAVTRYLRNAHWGRALALGRLGRHTDALPDWERALELDDGSRRPRLRLGRADSLARTGRAAEAVAEATDVAAAADVTAATVFECARVHALAAAAPADPDAGRHAARAVELLRQAVGKGYQNVPKLLADADLAPLRRRADYADLLWGLADLHQ